MESSQSLAVTCGQESQAAVAAVPRQGAALVVAAGLEPIAAIAAMMALGGATCQLPTVLSAQAASTRAVRLLVAGATHRLFPRRFLRRFPHRTPRQGAVDAAGSEQTAATAAKMALGGATSLLPIVLSAQAVSTRAVRPRPAAGAPAARGPRQPQCPRLLQGHPWRNMEG